MRKLQGGGYLNEMPMLRKAAKMTHELICFQTMVALRWKCKLFLGFDDFMPT